MSALPPKADIYVEIGKGTLRSANAKMTLNIQTLCLNACELRIINSDLCELFGILGALPLLNQL